MVDTLTDLVRFDLVLPRDLRDRALSAARAVGMTTLAPFVRQALLEKLGGDCGERRMPAAYRTAMEEYREAREAACRRNFTEDGEAQ